MNYTGISGQSIFLLAENRFNDSRSFYEQHKEEIRKGIIIPLRQIVDDVSDLMLKLNPDMILSPARCVSRVRRDTRFTHDKSLYRENMWVMFRHQKNQLPTPSFWFEFFPGSYNIGLGIVSSSPAFMQYWRSQIVERRDELLGAVKKAKSAGLILDSDCYRRSKAEADGIDAQLAPYYDLKSIFFVMHTEGTEELNEPELFINKLRKAYTAAGPLYKFFLSLTTAYNCAEEVLV